MVVPFAVEGDRFRAGKPVSWTERDVTYNRAGYALHPDGERIAIESAAPRSHEPRAVTLVTNFFDELRRLAPLK